jgi:asparagine synthase (glutamine-hydrolysing)
MGLPIKMQFAINVCGLGKVIWAAVCAGVGKIFGKHGVFYEMLGEEVSGLDGFYGEDIPEYEHMGVRVPRDPDKVCDEVYEKTGVVMMIVDANDLNVELLGKGQQLKGYTKDQLLDLIRDNPAGQDRQLTPFVLIREVKE